MHQFNFSVWGYVSKKGWEPLMYNSGSHSGFPEIVLDVPPISELAIHDKLMYCTCKL